MPEEISTPRLILRPVESGAAREVLDGRGPTGLRLADGYPSRFSLDLVAVAIEGSSSRDVGPFFVVRRADRTVVGEIGCRLDTPRTTAHVGYTIVESCWNRGYASEALRGLIDYLLHGLSVPRVEAETLASHVASRRVMEKAGMTLGATRRFGEQADSVELVSYAAMLGSWSLPALTVPPDASTDLPRRALVRAQSRTETGAMSSAMSSVMAGVVSTLSRTAGWPPARPAGGMRSRAR